MPNPLPAPPLADWTRPCWCPGFAQYRHRHGPLVAFRITGPRTADLDDMAREVITGTYDRPRNGLWAWPLLNPYVLTQAKFIPALVEAFTAAGALNRLVLRDIPDPYACTHIRCERKNLAPLVEHMRGAA